MGKTVDGIIYSDDMETVEGVSDKGIKSAFIPDGVKYVVMQAFKDCSALEEVSIPDSMLDIKKSAFKNCTSLMTVSLGDNVEYLDSSWFFALKTQYEIKCRSESQTYKLIKRSSLLKAHVKELSHNDAKSEKIKQVQGASIDAVLSSLLSEEAGVKYQVLTNRKTGLSVFFQIGKNAGSFRFSQDSAKWIEKIRKIIEILSDQEKDGAEIYAKLKANKISLADMSTSGAYKLATINADADGNANLFSSGRFKGSWVHVENTLSVYGIRTLGSSSFDLGSDNGFKNLILTDGLETIESGAFWNSGHVKSITFPETLEVIENGAFKACHGLTSVRLPESLLELGRGAFERCENLSEIYIPKSIKKIETLAFYGTNIENLGYSIKLNKLKDEKSVDVEFTIKDGFAFENDELLYETVQKETQKIPDGVSKIGDSAFYYSEQLKSIFIPKSVKEIDRQGFFCASSLTQITFGGTIAEWKAMKKVDVWNYYMPAKVVHCSDGDTEIVKMRW